MSVRELSTQGDHEPKPRTKKINYTKNHLPFPGVGRESYVRRWTNEYKTSLINWAGTVEDPFGTNGNSGLDDVVDETWKAVFPELEEALEIVDKRAAILGVVRLVTSYLFFISSYLHHRPSSFSPAGAAQSANVVYPLSRRCMTTKTPPKSRTMSSYQQNTTDFSTSFQTMMYVSITLSFPH